MKTKLYTAALFLPLAFSCGHDGAGERGIDVGGEAAALTYAATVMDEDDSPLDGVAVLCESLQYEPSAAVTDSRGAFALHGLCSDSRYTLTFSKDGYCEASSRIVMADRNVSGDVYVLAKLPPVVVEERIEVTPSALGFGPGVPEIILTVSATLRSAVEWHVTIDDTSWLQAEPSSGTLEPGGQLAVRFTVDRTAVKTHIFQLITVTVGGVTIPVMAEYRP